MFCLNFLTLRNKFFKHKEYTHGSQKQFLVYSFIHQHSNCMHYILVSHNFIGIFVLLLNDYYFLFLYNVSVYALYFKAAAIISLKNCLWVNKFQSPCLFITFMFEDAHRLSLRMLMHVKIHEHCSLFSHNILYLIVY
jgi:hypothetical protein